MNILVTGASGFIGRHLADTLASGDAVYGLVRDNMPGEWPSWSVLKGDVNDYPRMLDIIVNREIDLIYHMASRAIVRNCRVDPLDCFHTNVMGTGNVLEAARQSERIQGILCMESDKAYGDGPVPYVEDQALRPSSVYEASKACVSHVVTAYAKNYGLPVFSVRAANVYGPGDPNASRLIPRTITRLLAGEQPQITAGADDYEREFIYVDDFIYYAVRLMDAGPWGEAVNVGSGHVATVSGVVRQICKLMGKPFEPESWKKPETLSEITKQWLDLAKLNRILRGQVQAVTLHDGLERTIKWYRDRS